MHCTDGESAGTELITFCRYVIQRKYDTLWEKVYHFVGESMTHCCMMATTRAKKTVFWDFAKTCHLVTPSPEMPINTGENESDMLLEHVTVLVT